MGAAQWARPWIGMVSLAACSAAGTEDDGLLRNDAAVLVDAGREAAGDPDEAVCGDLHCQEPETCVECATDCGQCPTCDLAPTCTGAPAVPTESTRLEEFDNEGEPLYVCGIGLGPPVHETDCLDAQLRIRLRQIRIHRTGTLAGLNLFCLITASDGFSSELFITPRMTGVGDDHPPLLFDPLVSAFWGQQGLKPTTSNLTITYQCSQSTDNAQYQAMLEDVADVAVDAGGVAGPYGWAFGVGSIAATIAAGVLGPGGDSIWLNVQQTVDADAFLELTNGRIWEIQQQGDGTTFLEDWDWTLEIEAWGCADARPPPVY